MSVMGWLVGGLALRLILLAGMRLVVLVLMPDAAPTALSSAQECRRGVDGNRIARMS